MNTPAKKRCWQQNRPSERGLGLERTRRRENVRPDVGWLPATLVLLQFHQKNATVKSFEERRVLRAFASMGECPVAVGSSLRDQPAV
jgi:hypothetical protein